MCWYVRMYACCITFGFVVLFCPHTNGNIDIHCVRACVRVFMAKNDVHLLPSCKHFRSRLNQMLLNTCTTGIIMNCLYVCVWMSSFFSSLCTLLLLLLRHVYIRMTKQKCWCHIMSVCICYYTIHHHHRHRNHHDWYPLKQYPFNLLTKSRWWRDSIGRLVNFGTH